MMFKEHWDDVQRTSRESKNQKIKTSKNIISELKFYNSFKSASCGLINDTLGHKLHLWLLCEHERVHGSQQVAVPVCRDLGSLYLPSSHLSRGFKTITFGCWLVETHLDISCSWNSCFLGLGFVCQQVLVTGGSVAGSLWLPGHVLLFIIDLWIFIFLSR